MECVLCSGSGLVFTRDSKNTTRVYACSCEKGKPNREPRYLPGDKDKQRPVYIPVWGQKTNPAAKPPEGPPPEDKRLPYKDD